MNAHIHSTVFYRIVGMADIEQDFSIVKKRIQTGKIGKRQYLNDLKTRISRKG